MKSGSFINRRFICKATKLIHETRLFMPQPEHLHLELFIRTLQILLFGMQDIFLLIDSHPRISSEKLAV